MAVARITRAIPPAGSFRITFAGDGLAVLKRGDVALYTPAPSEPLLGPSRAGPSPHGRFDRVRLTHLRVRAGTGTVTLTDPHGAPLGEEAAVGAWLCAAKADLAEEDAVFVYQLVGLPVVAAEDRGGPARGSVVGYFDHGAHGILEIELAEGERLLVPFVERYCQLEPDESRIVISDLDLFRT